MKDIVEIVYQIRSKPISTILFMENKIFKGLLIRELINQNALPVLITISDEVLEAGGYDRVSITYNKVIKYIEAYQNFINFPIAVIGIHP